MNELRRPSVKTLETARLRLEPFAVRHVDSLWKSIVVSLDELKTWLPWAVNASIEEVRSFAGMCETDWDENKSWQFVILSGEEAIGVIGLSDAEVQTRRAELGYWMRTADAGKGFMTEAGAALIDFGFNELGLNRIELEAGIDNIGSQRVAEKLGFKREGMAREAGWAGVGFYDTIRYGLLNTDSRA